MKKLYLYCCFLMLFSLLGAQGLVAQHHVSGKVVDTKNEPLIGVNIVEKGTSNGVITDIDGNYSIEVSDGNTVLVFSFIGFEDMEVVVDNRTIVDVALQETLTELGEVVVTALGIKREKKTLGYSMQEVKTEDFNEVRSENVSNMLQGKIAGVSIAQSSSGTGGSTRVDIRGLNSLSGNNQPLWIVDGVPVDNSYGGSFDQWGGSDVATAASEINPDDIESISVLKGPNAAALYGSRAQNGAIVVTTKRGEHNESIEVNYNGNYTWTKIFDGYDFQWEYGRVMPGTLTFLPLRLGVQK
ncbi:TonB-dependent receptor plug domain-containing protein [Marinilabilia salmonicolor]|uniref:TonB-dependent receptor plug domain-containing protein n=1 Tax=Marinilabilia salmonicolor TaxID=989 RepID=UPI000A78F0F5|nr:TonB-dependent receptor plug domain-containing protein [Marinilabilia salmonicolor]